MCDSIFINLVEGQKFVTRSPECLCKKNFSSSLSHLHLLASRSATIYFPKKNIFIAFLVGFVDEKPLGAMEWGVRWTRSRSSHWQMDHGASQTYWFAAVLVIRSALNPTNKRLFHVRDLQLVTILSARKGKNPRNSKFPEQWSLILFYFRRVLLSRRRFSLSQSALLARFSARFAKSSVYFLIWLNVDVFKQRVCRRARFFLLLVYCGILCGEKE